MGFIELEERKRQYKKEDTYLSDIKYLITKQELLTRKCANCERFMSELTYMNDE
jgi:hypothetical protein